MHPDASDGAEAALSEGASPVAPPLRWSDVESWRGAPDPIATFVSCTQPRSRPQDVAVLNLPRAVRRDSHYDTHVTLAVWRSRAWSLGRGRKVGSACPSALQRGLHALAWSTGAPRVVQPREVHELVGDLYGVSAECLTGRGASRVTGGTKGGG
jgi:hypothetical protein